MSDASAPQATGVYPCLFYRNAMAAIDWLGRAFGFEKRLVVQDDEQRVVHSELSLGSVVVMVGSIRKEQGWLSPLDLGGVNQTICLTIPDPDAHYARATAAGATVLFPIKDQDYGSRDYTVRDLEGNIWTFGNYTPGAHWESAKG